MDPVMQPPDSNNTDPQHEPVVPTPVTYSDIVKHFLAGYKNMGSEEDQKEFRRQVSPYLKQEAAKHSVANDYNILVLFDNTKLIKTDADQIYRAIATFKGDKPLLLILLSPGGELGSAYLIGKLCQESRNTRFIVVVPRYAKSAATLLACAADEIHMGSLSELGPIDPQIGDMPTLGLKNSIEHIAGLVDKHPGAADMFAKYLKLSIEPVQIGYYERVAESATQYAEKLINHRRTPEPEVTRIASHLVYEYKDHGFVIDKAEARTIFGDNVIKSNTPEYQLGDALYTALSNLESLADIFNHSFYFIGSLDSEPNLVKRKKKGS